MIPRLQVIIDSYGLKIPLVHGRKIACMFADHNEKTPSWTYYSHTDTFNCFGCNRGGDSIYFAYVYEHALDPSVTFEDIQARYLETDVFIVDGLIKQLESLEEQEFDFEQFNYRMSTMCRAWLTQNIDKLEWIEKIFGNLDNIVITKDEQRAKRYMQELPRLLKQKK